MALKKKHWLAVLLLCVVAFGAAGGMVLRIHRTRPVMLTAGSRPRIIIDAGHGGMDGGAVGYNNIVEKDINLAIAQDLRDLFIVSGFDVVMTRDSDCSIHDDGIVGVKNQKTSDMRNRLKIIEQNGDAIFLSIHQNKFTDPKYSGAQMFYSPNLPQSEELAAIMQRHFREMLQPENTREHKQSGRELFLLYKAQTPAVLVECGFLSNPQEAANLTDQEYQEKVAFVIYSSVMEFLYSV